MLWELLSSDSAPRIRCCYLPISLLERFVGEAGVVEALLAALEADKPHEAGIEVGLQSLRRRAIHLSLSTTALQGLSVEEIVVLTALQSPGLEHAALGRELRRTATTEQLAAQCAAWLGRDDFDVFHHVAVGRTRWDVVGRSRSAMLLGDPVLATINLVTDAGALNRLLTSKHELVFAHNSYVACTPGTVLHYFLVNRGRFAKKSSGLASVERQLRGVGLGLILCDEAHAVTSHHAPFNVHPAAMAMLRATLESH